MSWGLDKALRSFTALLGVGLRAVLLLAVGSSLYTTRLSTKKN